MLKQRSPAIATLIDALIFIMRQRGSAAYLGSNPLPKRHGCTINPMMLPIRQITRTATSNVITIQTPTLGNLPNFSDIDSCTTLSWLVALNCLFRIASFLPFPKREGDMNYQQQESGAGLAFFVFLMGFGLLMVWLIM